MVRWSDLGAGLQASARVMLRPALWLQVLRRMFFSRVFLGYAFLGFLLFMTGRTLLAGAPATDGASRQVLLLLGMVALVYAPYVLLLAFALLLPYACWSFHPAAARLLTDYLDLPPAVEQEPAFHSYLAWALPAICFILLAGPAQMLSVVDGGALRDPVFYLTLALVALALAKLFIRGALAAHYPRPDIERFLAATRWQRWLLWLPVAGGATWGTHWLASALVMALGLATPYGTTTAGWLLVLALDGLVLSFVAIAFIGALLLACGRMSAGPHVGGAGADDAPLHSQTLPMSSPLLQRGRRQVPAPVLRQAPRRARRLGLAMLSVAGLAAGLFLARLPLADWALSQDPVYRAAPALTLGVQQPGGPPPGPLLDRTLTAQRLRAGYIAYGCLGQLERAQWIARLGVTQDWDHARLLACAACRSESQAADWLLARQPRALVSVSIAAAPGQPRTPLACAARDNNLPLAQALLARSAQPRQQDGGQSAIEAAAVGHHWDMVRLLLKADRAAAAPATFAALNAAHAKDPKTTAPLLPRMLAAGLAADAVDRQGRNLFHWAARHHDLPLLQALLARADPAVAAAGLRRPDPQGVLPWMYVLRRAELDGRPMTPEAAQMLRLLLPPDANVNLMARRGPAGLDDPFPIGWNAGAAAINHPAAREILGPDLDFGLLPMDSAWWKFNGQQEAQDFVRGATQAQLLRAQTPDAINVGIGKPLSLALVEAGWSELADEVQQALLPKRR